MGQPRLRIVHCFRSPVGGIFRHVRDLVTAQHTDGHKVGIVCDAATGGEFEDKLFAELEPFLAMGFTRIPMQRHVGLGDLAAAWRTFKTVRKLKPDVLHGHGAKGGVYARLFGSLLRVSGSRVARLYSPHGGSLHYDEDTLTGKSIFFVERLLERQTDRLLFVSAYERETYQRKIGAPKARNSIVYNGLGQSEFKPVKPAKDAAEFLYIGMMRDLKGPDIFIDALNLANTRTGLQMTAVMVGDGDDLEKYREQAAALGLSDLIRFLPPMPAREAFRLSKTVVVPSRAEAMPYIVLEALAAGMPMIATRVGGIPEIFDGHDDVLRTPEPPAIADAMIDVAADRAAYRAKMPSPAKLKERFAIDVMTADIDAAYREALGQADT